MGSDFPDLCSHNFLGIDLFDHIFVTAHEADPYETDKKSSDRENKHRASHTGIKAFILINFFVQAHGTVSGLITSF